MSRVFTETKRAIVSHLLAGVALATVSASALAMKFDAGGTEVTLDSLVTVGGAVRLEDRNPELVGKSNLTPGLCVHRITPDPFNSPNRRYAGDTCTTGGDGSGNLRALAAPGALNPNGDNGDLNFDKHDVAYATAKITSDLSFRIADFGFFARGIALFDNTYSNLKERHPDTAAQLAKTDFSKAGKNRIGLDVDLLDYFVFRNVTIGDHEIGLKLGNQVLNWGESAFLVGNSLNSINPPNAALLRLPGFDVKELLQPVGMLVANGDLVENVNLQLFYQYQWKPVVLDPVGSYFSSSDLLGEGGRYVMLGFGKNPEDPEGVYEPWRNNQDAVAALGSTSSRTVSRNFAEEERRKPDADGQFGGALRLFLENLNGGSEVGLYYANYHSRIPSVSAIAAQNTCIPASTGNAGANLAAMIAACQIPLTNLATLAQLEANPDADASYAPAGRDVLPVDTMSLFAEYPKNIHLYGTSFNTTLGDYAFAGELSYRPNLPIQIHSTDLVFAALQPAIPEQPYDIGAGVLPGRREAAPDFISTNYRHHAPQAGEYIRGWEPMKIGQLDLTLLRTFGGDNFLRASQITLLLEAGYTKVFDFPALSELQFNGAATNTHISAGGDGSAGINPSDIRSDPNDPHSSRSLPDQRQNPIAQDPKNFGTENSYGYRLVTSLRYDDALFGGNLEFINILFHDVKGIGPGVGQNFIEGRKQFISGVRFDYLTKYITELRYTNFFGGGIRDPFTDRDNLSLYLGYQF